MTLRGTLIIADQVYKTVENKWVISGTYNQWYTAEQTLISQAGLIMYIRLLTDSVGIYNGYICLTEDAADPRNDKYVWKFPVQLPINTDGVPVAELKLVIPSLRIDGPPLASRQPGAVYVMSGKVRLFLGLADQTPTEVAYAPLIVAFHGPNPGVDLGHEQSDGDDRPEGNGP